MSRKPRFDDIQFIFLNAFCTELMTFFDQKIAKRILKNITFTLISEEKSLPFNLSFSKDDITFYYTHCFKPEFISRLKDLEITFDRFQEIHQKTLSFFESIKEKGKIKINNTPYLSLKKYKELPKPLSNKISTSIIKYADSGSIVSIEVPPANRLKDAYFISNTNMFWTLDVTQRGKKRIGYILAILDAASRCIINYTYSEVPFSASSVIELLDQTIQKFGKPRYVHSDQGGLFVSDLLTNYLNKQNIFRSLTIKSDSYSRWGNQVHEVFHRNFWASVGVLRDCEQTVEAWDQLPTKARLISIKITIEIFNHENAKVRSYYTREEIDRLLRCETALKLNIKAKNNTEIAKLIEVFHLYVASHHEGDYLVGLIEQVFNTTSATAISMIYKLREENHALAKLVQEQTMWVTSSISVAFFEVANQLKMQREENIKSRLLIEQLQADLDEIKSHTSSLYTKEQVKEALRQKRKNRKRQVSRDACTYNDYLSVLSCVKSKDRLIEARNKVALTLLYMTGLRVSNLMNITYGHLERLLNKEDISITLVKTRQNHIQQTYPWQSAYSKLVSSIEKEIKLLIASKKEESSPFTLSREHLNRSLNHILDEASKLTKKNLRTHSFRINLCDQIIDKKGLHVAQKVLGHKSIVTTQLYNRTGLTKREIGSVLRESLAGGGDDIIDITIDKHPRKNEP